MAVLMGQWELELILAKQVIAVPRRTKITGCFFDGITPWVTGRYNEAAVILVNRYFIMKKTGTPMGNYSAVLGNFVVYGDVWTVFQLEVASDYLVAADA